MELILFMFALSEPTNRGLPSIIWLSSEFHHGFFHIRHDESVMTQTTEITNESCMTIVCLGSGARLSGGFRGETNFRCTVHHYETFDTAYLLSTSSRFEHFPLYLQEPSPTSTFSTFRIWSDEKLLTYTLYLWWKWFLYPMIHLTNNRIYQKLRSEGTTFKYFTDSVVVSTNLWFPLKCCP